MGSIRVSEKHGVNPSINVCFFCNEDKNEIILPGRLPGDAEAPHRGVWNKEPCDKCKEHMKTGIILIGVRDGETNDNPYRTGGWVVIKEEAFKRIFNDHAAVETRVAFIEQTAWKKIGLPGPEEPDRG